MAKIEQYITARTASYQQLKENARRMRKNPTEGNGEQHELDIIRENKLISEGYRIIRFTNEEIYTQIEQTIECIKNHLI